MRCDVMCRLIIAVKFDPLVLLQRLWPSLGLSRPFVIYSQYMEVGARACSIVF